MSAGLERAGYQLAAKEWLAVALDCVQRAAECYALAGEAADRALGESIAKWEAHIESERRMLRLEWSIRDRLTAERGFDHAPVECKRARRAA